LFTTITALSFTWQNGASNGGSPIIGYNVYFDQGVGNFIMLTSGVTLQSYTTSAATPITTGANYKFMVQARNVVGLSQNSTQFNILAAIVPGAPSVPVTSND
jgi:hypothetical protein